MISREQELLITSGCLSELANAADAADSFPESVVLEAALRIVDRQLAVHRQKEQQA